MQHYQKEMLMEMGKAICGLRTTPNAGVAVDPAIFHKTFFAWNRKIAGSCNSMDSIEGVGSRPRTLLFTLLFLTTKLTTGH